MPEHLELTRPFHIKAIGGDTGEADEGTFEALVSAYGVVDYYGEVVRPGAFKDTLAEWKASGDPIPVLWAHMSHDPTAHIGFVLEAEERTEGLWVKGQLDIAADPASSKAPAVWRLLKGRRVREFSFAFDVLDGGMVTVDGESIYELRRLKLFEVGPCLIGVNPETELLSTKAVADRTLARVKAGRVISAKNEGLLRDAHTAIGEVLSALDKTDDGKARQAPGANDEPGDRKSEELPRLDPARIRVAAALDLLGAGT